MLSINTNLSSLIAQNSMKTSTDKLNQAIERMSTGFKINHAKDNAANYSISTNMTTKIGSYQIAEENCAMGLDMVTTASSTLDLVSEHVQRIRDLCEQASNGTYGEESLKAIQSEIDARQQEVDRILAQTEYNGIKLFESAQATPATFATPRAGSGVTGAFIEEVDQLTEEEAIAQGYTVIKTADDLQNMQNNLSGKYILMNDIDLTGYDWTPIGTNYSNYFSGELNGNGFVIKNLTINEPAYVGLFGSTSGATIKNIGIENADITTGSSGIAGILMGVASNTIVLNVYAVGTITGNSYLGGLIGEAQEDVYITNCYTNVSVSGHERIGGIIGSVYHNGPTLTNCYSIGDVTGNSYVGGIIGGGDGVKINDSYSKCIVSGTSNISPIDGNADALGQCNNVYYIDRGISPSAYLSATAVTEEELQTLINSGSLPKINPLYVSPATPTGSPSSITLQVGTRGDSNSQITFGLATTLTPLGITITDSDSARDSLTIIDNYLSQISNYQTSFGAVQNRLESCLEEISVQYDNLVSSRSTLRDADIAEESSKYIQAQILQQASATLMATANQSPSIALQLI